MCVLVGALVVVAASGGLVCLVMLWRLVLGGWILFLPIAWMTEESSLLLEVRGIVCLPYTSVGTVNFE